MLTVVRRQAIHRRQESFIGREGRSLLPVAAVFNQDECASHEAAGAGAAVECQQRAGSSSSASRPSRGFLRRCFFTSMFFQKLKHRARECASVLVYCSVTAYLHQRMTCYCGSYQESSWEAFPGRELKNFPNVGGALKGIQRCVLLFRRSVTNRVFAVCQMPEFHGQHASAMFPHSLR